MLFLVQGENEQDQSHVFQEISSECYLKNQLVNASLNVIKI